MKRIALGHLAALVDTSGCEVASQVKDRRDEFSLSKLYYSFPKEPEIWQGKGNRRKPMVK